jgi:hypothetical protein
MSAERLSTLDADVAEKRADNARTRKLTQTRMP